MLQKQNHCFYCGHQMFPVKDGSQCDSTQTIDHVTPKARGGGNKKHNLRLTCFLCNQLKMHHDPVWFIDYLKYLKDRTTLLNRWHQLHPVERTLVFMFRDVHKERNERQGQVTFGDLFKNLNT